MDKGVDGRIAALEQRVATLIDCVNAIGLVAQAMLIELADEIGSPQVDAERWTKELIDHTHEQIDRTEPLTEGSEAGRVHELARSMADQIGVQILRSLTR